MEATGSSMSMTEVPMWTRMLPRSPTCLSSSRGPPWLFCLDQILKLKWFYCRGLHYQLRMLGHPGHYLPTIFLQNQIELKLLGSADHCTMCIAAQHVQVPSICRQLPKEHHQVREVWKGKYQYGWPPCHYWLGIYCIASWFFFKSKQPNPNQ